MKSLLSTRCIIIVFMHCDSMAAIDIIAKLGQFKRHQLERSLAAKIINLVFGFIIITCKFNTVTLSKCTNLTCPKGSSSINLFLSEIKDIFCWLL